MGDLDQRTYALEGWALEQLRALFPTAGGMLGDATFSVVSGDASFRRYFRLSAGELHWICVDAPPDKEDVSLFVRVTELLLRHGLVVPDVLSFDLSQGFLLLTDLGDELFLRRLHQATTDARARDRYYQQALDVLCDLQGIPTLELHHTPRYTAERLQREMDFFEEWFVPHYLRMSLRAKTLAMLQSLYSLLIDNALAQPQVLVHLDYQSRNLMWVGDETLALIDYQDAVVGPITYDLVSLLRDCYIRWPTQWIQRWAIAYADQAATAGLCERVPDATWLRWFDWMGLQRHIKVCGVFSRLNYRDGKPGYLRDIPLVVRYLLDVSRRYCETQPFAAFLEGEVLPALYRVNPEARLVVESDPE